jgi:(p)ppGpp synthase/HD superfamily hydrolase
MTPGTYSPRFDDAVALAVSAFRGIVRKQTTIPYVTHLFTVCALVGEHGGDEDQMIAAMLHDYLEDVPGARREDLESRFGERVTRIVVALSDSVTQPKPPWKQRKQTYLAHLRFEPAEVKLVSAADKLHNCSSILRDHREIGDRIFERFTADKANTLWYYDQVHQAIAHEWHHPLADELGHAVRQLHSL